jgi:concentrative nucleoside transporter, CNT family
MRRFILINISRLCGFSNFSSIGIQIASIGGLAVNRKKDLAQIGFRALVTGTVACFLTANIAAILVD